MRNPYARADERFARAQDAALDAEYAAIANAEYWRDDCEATASSLKAEFVGNCDENNPPQIEHWHEWLLDCARRTRPKAEAAMRWLIDNEAPFTTLSFLID